MKTEFKKMMNLNELVSIKSDDNQEEILAYLENKLKNIAEEIKIVQNKEDGKKSIIIGINTLLKAGVRPIVLSGHIDTVNPNNEKYLTNPYSLVVKDGKAYGLGSIDMKSFIAVILDNINQIKSLKTPIILSFTTDAYINKNLYCVENVINTLKELEIKPTFTIIGEPTNQEIQVKANGCYEYEVLVYGKSCHSSKIANGINSICIIAKLVSYIEEEQKSFTGLTSNCGIIGGGDIINRVPDFAKLSFDIRASKPSLINAFLTKIYEKIQELENEYEGASIVVEKKLEIPPLEDKQNQTIKYVANLLNLQIGEFSGGCEAGYYQAYSGDAFLFGVGSIDLAHKPNEYVVVSEYEEYSKKLLGLLKFLENKVKLSK